MGRFVLGRMREGKFDLRTNERECWIVEIHILHATLLKSGYVAVLPFFRRKYVSKGIICNKRTCRRASAALSYKIFIIKQYDKVIKLLLGGKVLMGLLVSRR